MKTKIFFFFLFFSFSAMFSFASSKSHAGIGSSLSYSLSTSQHSFVSFTARSDLSPWVVFFNAHFNQSVMTVFADNWFINESLSSQLDYFVFWGISGGIRFEDEKRELATGCRFGAGVDFFCLNRRLEFFAQTVWNPYFGVKKIDKDCSLIFRPVNFPCSAGIRMWF